MTTTQKTSLFTKILLGTGTTLAIAAMGAIAFVSSDPTMIDRGLEAQVVAMVSNPNEPTQVWAFEGYGDTCTREYWEVPSQYDGVRAWRNAVGDKATPISSRKAEYTSACDKNFNPRNPAVPLSGLEYGSTFGLRPEHHVGIPANQRV
jgi:hypothetical protein